MSKDQWPAPAKLNLFLHIIGRREDGYHQLQTVFQLLEFGDELTFNLRNDAVISLAGNYAEINPEQDLIYRAALLLQQHSAIKLGVDINIVKRIPLGGGLGGGSSDAATTLVALNQLWGTDLSTVTLAQLGLRLGADVPVFIQGFSAWGEGIGEKLTPITLPEQWFLVIHPGCHVPTVRIFNTPDLTRNTSPITIRHFLDGAGHNDCKKVVFREYPEVARAAAWLDQWTEAKLTGTGACIFGQFATQLAAQEVLTKLPKSWQGFVSKGKNVSPLRAKLIQSG
jgi:4-diphosphocytidyl-2-C-methyl-D-erythritol kinase